MTVENKQKYNSTSRELLGLEAAKGRLRGRIDSEKSVAISLQPARLICNVNRLQSKPLFGWATKSLSYKAKQTYRWVLYIAVCIRVHNFEFNSGPN